MRIAMFTDSWLPARDGCVSSILKFRDGLEKRGHKVFIFAPEDKTGKVKEDDKTFLFKAKEFAQYPQYRMAISLSSRKDKLIKENDIQMLHSHGVAFMGFKAMMSSRILKLPYLMHFHTWVTEATQYFPVNVNQAFIDKASWAYLRTLCKYSDGVVAPSESAIEELKRKIPGMAYTDWVFPGIDKDQFNPQVKGESIRQKHGLENNDIILHVGRLSMEKNLELILRSMTEVLRKKPAAKLLIVGDGPARDHYKEYAKKLHIEDCVIFAGLISDEELPKYYAASDSFVIASKFETLGIVMIEALASGKPVAGINYRVIPDVIKTGYNGYIFNDNERDCADKIIASLEAPDEMGMNATQSASIFNSDASIDKLEGIYKRTEDIHEGRMKKRGQPYTRIT